jgi:hypothetical protein
MNENTLTPEPLSDPEQEQIEFKDLSCSELRAYLDRNWAALPEQRQSYLMFLMVEKRCQGVVPYLLQHLEGEDPDSRWQALSGLAEFKCREYRPRFVDLHLNDPDDFVRQQALLHLGDMFRNERDQEILALALTAWDDPASTAGMRLTAGAVMMYQLDIPHDETGRPAWWDEHNVEELEHPSILQAVGETRKLLAQGTPKADDEG